MRLLRTLVLTVSLAFVGLSTGSASVLDHDKDHRLEETVTIDSIRQPLRAVLGQLSTESGVTLVCGSNSRDWQVRDKLVSVHAHGQPLGQVMSALSDLLHFSWTVDAARDLSDPVYRLIQTAAERKQQEALRDKLNAARVSALEAHRVAAVAGIERIGDLSRGGKDADNAAGPWLRALAADPVGAELAHVLKFVPGLRSAVLSGTPLEVSLDALPADSRDAALRLGRAAVNFKARLEPVDWQAEEHEGDVSSAKLIFNPQIPSSEPDLFDAGVVGEILISGIPLGSIPIMDPDCVAAKYRGSHLLEEATDGSYGSFESLDAFLGMELTSRLTDDCDLPEDDEALLVSLDVSDGSGLEGSSQTLAAILNRLSDKTSLILVSDHYPRDAPFFAPRLAGRLRDVLVSVAAAFGKRVKKTGNCVLFEDQIWFEKRAWEIPEADLARWRKAVRDWNVTFDDAVDMARLQNPQIDNNLVWDEEIGPVAERVVGERQRSILRLYGILNNQQRMLLVRGGLLTEQLMPEQMAYYQRLLPGDEELHAKSLRLTLAGSADGRAWRFRLQRSDVPVYDDPVVVRESEENISLPEPLDQDYTDVSIGEVADEGTSSASELTSGEPEEVDLEGVISEWFIELPPTQDNVYAQ